jgi:hypothetical protein
LAQRGSAGSGSVPDKHVFDEELAIRRSGLRLSAKLQVRVLDPPLGAGTQTPATVVRHSSRVFQCEESSAECQKLFLMFVSCHGGDDVKSAKAGALW